MWGKRHKRAVVVGPYRVHNFGDDLVGAIIAKHLQGRGYVTTVPRLGAENCAWLGIEFAADYADLLASADTIVVGGGGIMSDTAGAKPGASYLDIVARAAIRGELQGKRVLVTSVGAGPWLVERSRTLAFGVSLLAERIGVRDRDSLEHLESIGVHGDKVVLGADCALLSDEYLSFSPLRTTKSGFQFDVGAFADVQANPQLPDIERAVRDYARANAESLTLVSNGRRSSELAEACPGIGVLTYSRLSDFLPRLAGHRALFTSHLHLAITSFSQRIPTFSLYVREKTRRFYDQIGRPERAIDLAHATADDFHRLMREMETAEWTDRDEEALLRLQADARRLLAFVD